MFGRKYSNVVRNNLIGSPLLTSSMAKEYGDVGPDEQVTDSRTSIGVRCGPWAVDRPGWMEAGTVPHGGGSSSGEYINETLERYLLTRDRPIKWTRSRPYKKNDQAHVEQKNYTHVRLPLRYGQRTV